jgi:hypothetical protein
MAEEPTKAIILLLLLLLRLPPPSPLPLIADFYLWGHLKGTVYQERVNAWDEFQHLIEGTATTI